MANPNVEWSGDRLIAIAAASIVLSSFFLACRVYARFWLKKAPVGLDDVLLAAAYPMCLGMAVCVICGVQYALIGYHFQDALAINPDVYTPWSKTVFASEFIYLAAISLPKLSILALYRRVFVGPWVHRTIYGLMGLVVAYWVAFFVACWVQCIPFQGLWDHSIPSRCVDIVTFYKYVSLPAAIIDLPIIILPVPLLLRLQMTNAKKAVFVAIFLCGSLGIVACCIRLALFFVYDVSTDPTWLAVYLLGITTLESALYTIAACLLAMHPLYELIGDKFASSALGSYLRRVSRRVFGRVSAGLQQMRRVSQGREAPMDLEEQQRRNPTSWLSPKLTEAKISISAHGTSADNVALPTTHQEVGLRRDVWVQHSPVATPPIANIR